MHLCAAAHVVWTQQHFPSLWVLPPTRGSCLLVAVHMPTTRTIKYSPCTVWSPLARSECWWLFVICHLSSVQCACAGCTPHTFSPPPAGMPPDANAGRIWVESADSGRWRLLLRPQQLDQLKQVLEPRGVREGGLHSALLRVEGAVRAAMPGRPLQMPPTPGG